MDQFTTTSLTAERLREDHLADLAALHLDPEVSRYIGGVRSAERTKAYLAVNMAHWDQHGLARPTAAVGTLTPSARHETKATT